MVSVKFKPIQKCVPIKKFDDDGLSFNDDHSHHHGSTKKDEKPYYYYIRNGDFDIVWSNVAVFVIGHVLFFYTYWFAFYQVENRLKHLNTVLWGEFLTLELLNSTQLKNSS